MASILYSPSYPLRLRRSFSSSSSTSMSLRPLNLVSCFSGQKLKACLLEINTSFSVCQASHPLPKANMDARGGKVSHSIEVLTGGDHLLDDISSWISKNVANILCRHLPKDFDPLDWLPRSIHCRIHSSERAATIFVRECLIFGMFYALFIRADNFCRWLNWIHLSNTRPHQEIRDADYESSSFRAMRGPLRAGIVLWAITRLIHVSSPLLNLNLGLFVVEKVRSVGLVLAVTWFLFRWKKLVVDNLIMRNKIDAPRIIAFDKILSLALYYIAGTWIGEVSGFALRSILAIGGISGIAVGLAAKEIVGNFLGGTILFISRPFVIGDKIKAGSLAGEVEDIDFLHTKIIGRDKSPVHIPNQTILSQVITNYSRAKSKLMDAVFQLRTEDIFLVDRITERVADYLSQHPKVDYNSHIPVCYLKSMGAQGLEIEILCVIREKGGILFYKAQQEILVQVAQIISEEGAAFERSGVFPTPFPNTVPPKLEMEQNMF